MHVDEAGCDDSTIGLDLCAARRHADGCDATLSIAFGGAGLRPCRRHLAARDHDIVHPVLLIAAAGPKQPSWPCWVGFAVLLHHRASDDGLAIATRGSAQSGRSRG